MRQRAVLGPRDGRLKSKGCLSCIRMKVKCDEAKPHCQRCQRARRCCPGYRHQAQETFIFRMENSEKPLVTPCYSPPPTHSLHGDWLQGAVCRFFHHFVATSSAGSHGFLEFLPQLYSATRSSLCLKRSVEAISMASLAQAKHLRAKYLLMAREAYGEALRLLHQALSFSSEATSPAVLATICLLWKFDIIMGEGRCTHADKSPHRRGQLEVLRIRSSCSVATCTTSNSEEWIDRSALAIVCMQSLTCSSVTEATPTSDIPLLPTTSSAYAEPLAMLQKILLPRLASTINTVASGLAERTPTADEIVRHAGQLLNLHRQLMRWEVSLPERLRYESMPRAVSRQHNHRFAFPPFYILFPSVSVAAIWIAYWLARLSLLRSLTLILSHWHRANGLPSISLPDIRADMQSVAGSICSSVPHLIGDVDDNGNMNPSADSQGQGLGALFATRALYMTAQLQCMSDEQVAWILDRMEFIGQEMGIRQALVLREEIMSKRLAE